MVDVPSASLIDTIVSGDMAESQSAVVMDQIEIVETLLEAELDVVNFRRCGRMSTLQPAERLGTTKIVSLIRNSVDAG